MARLFVPYFADRVPDPAYRPVAGSAPTVLPAVQKGEPVLGTSHPDSAPTRRGARVPVHGVAAVPGSVPSVLDPITTSSNGLATMHVGHVMTSQMPIVIEAVLIESASNPAARPTENVGAFSPEPPEELAPVHYPRHPVSRHMRKKRI